MAAKGPSRRPGLDNHVRHLVSIAVLATAGDDSDLARYLTSAIASGVPQEEIREILLQIVLFAGYPRGIAALEALKRVAVEGQGASSASVALSRFGDSALLKERGRKVFEQVYPANADQVLAHLAELHPALPEWILTNAYGFVMARAAVPLRVREYIAVAALVTLGQHAQLLAHLRGALHAGGTEEELREVLSQISLHLDESQIEQAYQLFRKIR